MKTEVFLYECPHCKKKTNAATVAASLPPEIIRAERSRRVSRFQTAHPGPGRPMLALCPGCDGQLTAAKLRTHRVACVRQALEKMRNQSFCVWLRPKDPDPYPDFMIDSVGDEQVKFEKLSCNQYLAVEIQKIAAIRRDEHKKLARIRLLGRVSWVEHGIPRPEWRFMPSGRIGRPKVRAVGKKK